MPVVAALLQHGADPNARDAEGRAPPHILFGAFPCTAEGKQDASALKVAQALVDAGGDLHAPDAGGRTALQEAVRNWRPVRTTAPAAEESDVSADAATGT